MKKVLKYLWTPLYKGAVAHYRDMVKQVQGMEQQGYKEEVIEQAFEKLKNKQNELMNTAKNESLNTVSSQMKRIELAKKSLLGRYENPQAELLKRQDFDMKLELLKREEIADLLGSETATFSEYELNKMALKFREDATIQYLLTLKREQLEKPYLSDEEYTQLNQAYYNLPSLYSMGVFYYPTAEGYDKVPYVSTLQGILRLDVGALDSAVTELGKVTTQLDRQMLTAYVEQEKEKQLKYPEFDERIFRGSDKFDVITRFKYLQERFDDTETNYFNPLSEGYDVMEHLEFLEAQHDAKLEGDDAYRKKYEEAEKTAVGNK